ncbi:PAS domain-containing protein [Enterobacter ludwigii]
MAVGDRIDLFKRYQEHNVAAASVEMSRIYFYESTTEPCGIKDLDLRFIYANEAYRKILNLPLDYDVSGKTFEDMAGRNDEFTSNIRTHEQRVIAGKKASFAREFIDFENKMHPIPYVFLRTPYFSDVGTVSALEFYALSWHKFASMHHQDPDAIFRDGKLLNPYDMLTDKQWSVLYLHCTGLTLREIAESKSISHSAVKKSINRSTKIIQRNLQFDTTKNIIPELINLGWLAFLPADFISNYQQYTIYNFSP